MRKVVAKRCCRQVWALGAQAMFQLTAGYRPHCGRCMALQPRAWIQKPSRGFSCCRMVVPFGALPHHGPGSSGHADACANATRAPARKQPRVLCRLQRNSLRYFR